MRSSSVFNLLTPRFGWKEDHYALSFLFVRQNIKLGWEGNLCHRQNSLNYRKNQPHYRRLSLENLEERALLAVTTGAEIATALDPASETLIVTTLADTVDDTDGVLSLREAITAAAAGDTVTFDASLAGGTIVLSGTNLEISKGITIDATSIGGMTINANRNSRVFVVSGGTEANPVQLIVLTIQMGMYYNYGSGNGGGIYNKGTLTLTNCAVSGNSAGDGGGGIFNSGTLTLTNCTVSGNSVKEGNGGGIYNKGTLTLTNCTVSGN